MVHIRVAGLAFHMALISVPRVADCHGPTVRPTPADPHHRPGLEQQGRGQTGGAEVGHPRPDHARIGRVRPFGHLEVIDIGPRGWLPGEHAPAVVAGHGAAPQIAHHGFGRAAWQAGRIDRRGGDAVLGRVDRGVVNHRLHLHPARRPRAQAGHLGKGRPRLPRPKGNMGRRAIRVGIRRHIGGCGEHQHVIGGPARDGPWARRRAIPAAQGGVMGGTVGPDQRL